MAKKDAMGQEVDSLYLSLGLNAADLEMGFQTAGQTVRQAMSRLNSEANQIRLKADIDVTRLEAAGKSVEALKAREKALNDELAIQQKKLELLNRAYQANAKTYGADHSLTRGVDTKRLYQTRDIERLKAQIALVNAELGKTGQVATTSLGKLTNALAAAQGGAAGIVGTFGKMNAAIAGVVAATAAGAGIFALTDKAMNAGNDLYMLSNRLHTTTAEAGKLSKVFQLAGTDINSVIPLLVRIDKQAEAASKSQNDLSTAMADYDFTLTDSKGKLLSTTEQLAQLAKGYKNAVAMGEELDFTTKALGARGAALVPLLQNGEAYFEIVNRLQSTGLLDPEKSRELYLQWQTMQMQAGALTGAVGQSLIPVAAGLMPQLTEGFAEMAKLIKDNQEGIKEFGSAAGEIIGGLSSAIVKLIATLGDLKKAWDDTVETDTKRKILEDANKDLGTFIDGWSTLTGVLGGVAGFMYGGPKGAAAGAIGTKQGTEFLLTQIGAKGLGVDDKYIDYYKQKQEFEAQQKKAFGVDLPKVQAELRAGAAERTKLEARAAEVHADFEQKMADATSKKLKEQLSAIRDKVDASIDQGKTEAKAWVDVADDIKKAMKDAAKEAQEANEALDRSIYALTHNDLQNSLHGLKKGKILEAQEKEVAQYLDSIYADSLTQRLNQIEREKKAWIQKGLDEVQATRAAEEQKKAAVNDSVKNMFTTQKKYLDIYRRAMAGEVNTRGAGYLWEKSDSETRQRRAISWIRSALMEEAGVDEGEWTDMKEVLGFQRAMKEANNWGMSMIRGGTEGFDTSELTSVMSSNNEQVTGILGQINSEVPQVNANLLQILGAIQQTGNNPPQINVNPVINVDLGGAYVFDNAMKKQLTDDITRDVANGVTSAVEQATSRINASFAN